MIDGSVGKGKAVDGGGGEDGGKGCVRTWMSCGR